jgi:hypothetical protein
MVLLWFSQNLSAIQFVVPTFQYSTLKGTFYQCLFGEGGTNELEVNLAKQKR